MASSRHHALLLILTCGLLVVGVNGNFTMQTPLRQDEFKCLEECKFYPDNQTLVLIDVGICRSPKGSSCQAVMGIAYYTTPIRMKDPATRTLASFNTSFTFREEPEVYNGSDNNVNDTWRRGDGFTFMMSSSNSWTKDSTGRFGIFSLKRLYDPDPKVVAIEFDSWVSNDTDPGLVQEGHVGLDVGWAISEENCFSYLGNHTLNMSLWHRDILKTWIEYDGVTKNLQFRIANTSIRPIKPLINCTYDLYDAVDEKMWIGFSGAVGDHWAIYYIYNWTFSSFGISPDFPSVVSTLSVGLIAGIACGGAVLAIGVVAVAVCLYRRKKRAQEEMWENDPGMLEMGAMPDFISYKHLSAATKQFSEKSKLGEGGFGSVYKGVLPKTGAPVAVKRVGNDSRQGEREFLAEVQIISQLRHRNIVELVGFCRDRGKFLLVYELMPRGSLDLALFKPESPEAVLSWSQRWRIVSGTAAALHYLHEGWRQQVIHRDVKSSNIMLDEQLNPKLGDFGLARLVDHEKFAPTTMVAGTFGYLAPEASGGKFTDKTDVFAFGAVCLEVACGRKAYDGHVENYDELILGEVVWRRMNEDNLLSVADPLLLGQFDAEEMCNVLKLGLLCSHPDPYYRPSMRQVVQVLAGDADVPDVPEPIPKPSIGSGKPKYSIEDLMTSKSGTHSSNSGSKRPAPVEGTANSFASSSSQANSTNFSTVTTLHPR
ncbi:hypothetical protein KC19_8G089400 [Ceratodon purpureus]|uniref:Protein kinase domain-containing protein n=1 Tax=Ceratodon purpureus TaxID=3225 RepID=A0A8T0GWW6_CERPU|nr:hypothetical protein KC19_8G089400 [Ceratodon purpureus]